MFNKKTSFLLAHTSLCIIFFWFGLLKVLGVSPANDLVHALLIKIPILNMWPFESFSIFLGLVEMCIGILFLFKKTSKLAFYVVIPHMTTAVLPLFLLPSMTWQMIFVPTLAGQYIIKNIVIVALAVSILFERK